MRYGMLQMVRASCETHVNPRRVISLGSSDEVTGLRIPSSHATNRLRGLPQHSCGQGVIRMSLEFNSGRRGGLHHSVPDVSGVQNIHLHL